MTATGSGHPRPNSVMILTNDHAAHAIGASGSVVNQTPRIDEIASRGVVLEHCFATNNCATRATAAIVGEWHMGDGVTDGIRHDPDNVDY